VTSFQYNQKHLMQLSSSVRFFMALGILLFCLSACVSPWDPANGHRQLSTATEFQKEILKHYVQLADHSVNERDSHQTDPYVRQAAAAARGEDPALIARGQIPQHYQGFKDLQKSWSRLQLVFRKDGNERSPRHSAKAQAMLECWIHEARSPTLPYQLSDCRAAFHKAITAAEKDVAAPRVMVVLLPKPGGKIGGVQIKAEDGHEQLLDSAYEGVQANRGENAQALVSDKTEITALFSSTLGAMPPRPQKFRLYFKEDSDDLTPESKESYRKLFQAVKDHPAPEVEVVGHTDQLGRASYNLVLSRKRAEAVRNLLIKDGLQTKHIDVTGRGENDPLVTSEAEGWERNRRVEITVR